MMTAVEIRQAFLDFFHSKGHTIVPSAPIVVKDDPTLMFTNAGMNQFKDYFLGNKPAPSPRIADTQKCLRVSGKHNDLEEVGVDTYHHTMFEMLGNWSFGDYFKPEAIRWSWELLTEVYKIPKDRLYVSVFAGDEKEGLPKSNIALQEWQKLVDEDRIIFGNKKDNFWEMGDTGPCGPCTEIHVDNRSDEDRAAVPGRTLVNADHPQVIEIWNNVFIQYNRKKDGTLENLPQRHVDTGMGLERLVRVIQGKTSNYDTDIFGGTIGAIAAHTGARYEGSDERRDVAFRVIADHLRAVCFAIADGQLPSNTGAGYVIRRILRRAIRYYYSYLDTRQPLITKLVPVLAAQFENVFPELHRQQDFVANLIREEEESFLRTLEKGLKRLDQLIDGKSELAGDAAFELYDTYGFPIDLTQLILSEKGIAVDKRGFDAALKVQKDRSRDATALDTGDWTVLAEGQSSFVGYNELATVSKVLRYRKVKSKGKESYQLVLDRTPFYAESGGQVGDTGVLRFGEEVITVMDTRKEADLIVHFVEALPATVSGEVAAEVDRDRRNRTEGHHTATHLLQAALRSVVGSHVAQKGSLVNGDYLRFDFSHFAKLTAVEVRSVEQLVNAKIRENVPVTIQEMSKDEALAAGATALFGEKYGDRVRVVTADPAYSVELCGGTHAAATGELGLFKIRSEGAIASGVRRIEAICGEAAERWVAAQQDLVTEIIAQLKTTGVPLKAIAALQAEVAALRKSAEGAEKAQIASLKSSLSGKGEVINGIPFLGKVVEGISADGLKKLALDLRMSIAGSAVVLAGAAGGKSSVVIALDEALVQEKGLDAVALVKNHVAPLIRGGGGGSKALATAGGQDVGKLAEVVAAIRNHLSAL